MSRGLVVTTHRPLPTAFKIAGWASFGTFAALTVASALAYQGEHCQSEDPICLSKGLDYVGLVTAGTGAALSGSFLFVNYMNAIDSSEELEQSKSAERRVQPCGQVPWKGATVQAAADGVRASAPTNDDGEAVLELGLRQDASQEVAVQFALDGALLGPLPVSSPWRSGLLHK